MTVRCKVEDNAGVHRGAALPGSVAALDSGHGVVLAVEHDGPANDCELVDVYIHLSPEQARQLAEDILAADQRRRARLADKRASTVLAYSLARSNTTSPPDHED